MKGDERRTLIVLVLSRFASTFFFVLLTVLCCVVLCCVVLCCVVLSLRKEGRGRRLAATGQRERNGEEENRQEQGKQASKQRGLGRRCFVPGAACATADGARGGSAEGRAGDGATGAGAVEKKRSSQKPDPEIIRQSRDGDATRPIKRSKAQSSKVRVPTRAPPLPLPSRHSRHSGGRLGLGQDLAARFRCTLALQRSQGQSKRNLNPEILCSKARFADSGPAPPPSSPACPWRCSLRCGTLQNGLGPGRAAGTAGPWP